MNIFELTQHNHRALAIYTEACRVLDLPRAVRKTIIDDHQDSERLAQEVVRVWKWRKAGGLS